MADHDRFNQRPDERGARGPEQGRSGAFRGESDVQRGQQRGGVGGAGGGRSEFGGYGGSGPGYGGGQRGGPRDEGQGGASGYGGRGATESGASWPGARTGGGRGAEQGGDDPARRWSGESWTERERYEPGGGTGYAAPSGLGWQTDTGYGAGATGYGGSGSGALGDGRSRQGAQGGMSQQQGMGGGIGASRNRGPKGWQRSDERIHDDVCERLANEHGIDPSEVLVEVNGGNVVLTGSVPDRGMKYRIEDIVDSCSGVRDVDNRLRVSRGGMGGMFGTGTMGLGTTTDARGRDERGGAGAPSTDSGSRGSLLGRLFGFATGAKLSDIMTRSPRTVSPDEPLSQVALAMKEQDVGAIPVCSGKTLTGMITDRDIVVRAAAAGKPLDQTKVSEVMTTQVHTCYEDEDLESALDKMGDLQIRRIPVVDRANQLVGIVSLGDFAQREAGDVEDALQDISKPT